MDVNMEFFEPSFFITIQLSLRRTLVLKNMIYQESSPHILYHTHINSERTRVRRNRRCLEIPLLVSKKI